MSLCKEIKDLNFNMKIRKKIRIMATHKFILLSLFFITMMPLNAKDKGFTDAAEFGFFPNVTGIENVKALQKAVDQTVIIIVSKPGIYFDNGSWGRSYYLEAYIPQQEKLLFDNVRVMHDEELSFVNVTTPVDVFTITNSSLRNSGILFRGKEGYVPDYGKTQINFYGNILNKEGEMNFLENRVPRKGIILKTSNNISISDKFKAVIKKGEGKFIVDSDLNGLKK